ncbi:MAG: GTPase, partial [Alphaproteobacteria bacterium]
TLTPVLGVVYVDQSEFVLADIPGLIEGAHEGAGLGDRFLGHVERCGALLHLIDCTQDDIVGAWRTIRDELEAYGWGLARKTEILCLNKIDAIPEEFVDEKRAELEEATGRTVHAISGASGAGVEAILRLVRETVERDREEEAEAAAASEPVTWTP